MSSSAQNRTMSISSGTEAAVFKDVLVGEVRRCPGQSNTHRGVNEYDDKEEAATANDPILRIGDFSLGIASTPQTTIKDGERLPVTPENLLRRRRGLRSGSSAVAYGFGNSLRREQGAGSGSSRPPGRHPDRPWTPLSVSNPPRPEDDRRPGRRRQIEL